MNFDSQEIYEILIFLAKYNFHVCCQIFTAKFFNKGTLPFLQLELKCYDWFIEGTTNFGLPDNKFF